MHTDAGARGGGGGMAAELRVECRRLQVSD